MKTIVIMIAAFFVFNSSIAQQDTTKPKKPVQYVPDGRYCTKLEQGKVVVTMDGKPVRSDVILKNGNKITATGTIIKKDGSIHMLKPGSCVNTEGNEVEHAKSQ